MFSCMLGTVCTLMGLGGANLKPLKVKSMSIYSEKEMTLSLNKTLVACSFLHLLFKRVANILKTKRNKLSYPGPFSY